ncbi:MAG: hypothetical protein QOE11_3293 [Solirubrobacteraceae bacterium]|jgi:hypothetical protein|nr:hypothetical protein [Solirubrobacteraceae bacterium]
MSDSLHPELRASDADREHAAEWLRRAAGDGQLTMDELDDRLGAAYTVLTRGELDALTADLQAPGGAVHPAAPPGGTTVRRGPGGARWLLAVMGGCERSGRWRLSSRCTVINVMGGSDLDLNQVELGDDRVELNVFSVMGGSEIHVPPGLNVEVSEFAILGGNSIEIAEEVRPAPGPVLHLRLFSIMGGTDVRRGPRLTRAELRELKRRKRGELGR